MNTPIVCLKTGDNFDLKKWVSTFFRILSVHYGEAFSNKITPHHLSLWIYVLDGISLEKLERGKVKLFKESLDFLEYAPNAKQFRALCVSHIYDGPKKIEFFKARKPEEISSLEVGSSMIKKCWDILRGKNKS